MSKEIRVLVQKLLEKTDPAFWEIARSAGLSIFANKELQEELQVLSAQGDKRARIARENINLSHP